MTLYPGTPLPLIVNVVYVCPYTMLCHPVEYNSWREWSSFRSIFERRNHSIYFKAATDCLIFSHEMWFGAVILFLHLSKIDLIVDLTLGHISNLSYFKLWIGFLMERPGGAGGNLFFKIECVPKGNNYKCKKRNYYDWNDIEKSANILKNVLTEERG